MSIRTNEFCDICEREFGEGHDKALIEKPKGRLAFAQLIWTYYKKSLQIFKKDETQEPVLHNGWVGSPNRLEFCDKHASDFNTLLKYFCKGHYGLSKILEEIKAEDDREWDKKLKEKEKEFKALHKSWSSRNKKGGS